MPVSLFITGNKQTWANTYKTKVFILFYKNFTLIITIRLHVFKISNFKPNLIKCD